MKLQNTLFGGALAQTKNIYEKITMLSIALFVYLQSTLASADFDFESKVNGNTDISGVAKNIDNSMIIVFSTIKGIGVVAGFIFVFMGIVSLKKSQDQGSNVSPFKGIFLILIGGMFGVLPFIFLTASATMGGTGDTTTG